MNLLKVILIVLVATSQVVGQQIEVKSDFFYDDGEKIFIKGIGYEVGAWPGVELHERTFDAQIMAFDLERIKSAGFNTIRTWGALTMEELDLVKSFNLKVIMGIWIDPTANFSDNTFRTEAQKKLRDVMSYSKYYDNIIAYLIMNEPLPKTVFTSGYDDFTEFLSSLVEIIHNQHPNRPVSISNTSNGTYIESSVFDFSAYNTYIYNPVTVNYLCGYQTYIEYLCDNNTSKGPLVVTEFGLPVSPSGPGNWGYGGNTLAEQANGLLYSYKALVNGGATGACVFHYCDGWWKGDGGSADSHEDMPEEWFGLVEYENVDDKYGKTRPAWDSISNYQSVIITSPKSGSIYSDKVLVEMFPDERIKKIEICIDERIIQQYNELQDYMLDSIMFENKQPQDVILTFYCYDSNGLIKKEHKNILVNAQNLQLPTIEINTNTDFNTTGKIEVEYKIDKSTDFDIVSDLSYIFYPHIGFDFGQKFTSIIPDNNSFSFKTEHQTIAETKVYTVGAAFNIVYNNFKKRIVNQSILTTEKINNSIQEIKDKEFVLYPNPSQNYFKISTPNNFDNQVKFNYSIIDLFGKIQKKGKACLNESIPINSLSPGIYHVKIFPQNEKQSSCYKMLKM